MYFIITLNNDMTMLLSSDCDNENCHLCTCDNFHYHLFIRWQYNIISVSLLTQRQVPPVLKSIFIFQNLTLPIIYMVFSYSNITNVPSLFWIKKHPKSCLKGDIFCVLFPKPLIQFHENLQKNMKKYSCSKIRWK